MVSGWRNIAVNGEKCYCVLICCFLERNGKMSFIIRLKKRGKKGITSKNGLKKKRNFFLLSPAGRCTWQHSFNFSGVLLKSRILSSYKWWEFKIVSWLSPYLLTLNIYFGKKGQECCHYMSVCIYHPDIYINNSNLLQC